MAPKNPEELSPEDRALYERARATVRENTAGKEHSTSQQREKKGKQSQLTTRTVDEYLAEKRAQPSQIPKQPIEAVTLNLLRAASLPTQPGISLSSSTGVAQLRHSSPKQQSTAPAAPAAQAEAPLPEDPLPEAPAPAAPSVAPTAAPAAQPEASLPEAPSVVPTVAPATQPEPSLPEAPVPASPSVASDLPAATEYVSKSSSQASEPPRVRYAPMARKVRESKCEDCGKSIPAGTKWDQAAQDGGKYCQECWSTWDVRCIKWVREQQESKAKELKEMQAKAAKNALDGAKKQLRAYEVNQLKEQLKSQRETLMMRASEQLEKEPKGQPEEEPATEPDSGESAVPPRSQWKLTVRAFPLVNAEVPHIDAD